MHRPSRLLIGIMTVAFASGCYGPFTLTRKVHHWNGQVSENKWVVEAVFLAFTFLPVYSIASAADAVIFNSVLFWSGKSMLDDSASSRSPSPSTRIAKQNTGTDLTSDPDAKEQAPSIQ